MSKVNVAALMRRLNDQALGQLCAEVTRLAAETERLREQLMQMESCADGWREDAMMLHEQLAVATGGTPGITQAGELVVVAQENADVQAVDGRLTADEIAWLDWWTNDGLYKAAATPDQEMSAHG